MKTSHVHLKSPGIKPLTQRELEEILPRESDDEQDSSGSENEDNLEDDFSLQL
jgi:hypothetical protein